MKGNLATLKKICRYASFVMTAGAAILSVMLAAFLVLGVGSALGVESASRFLEAWTGADSSDSVGFAAAFVEMALILALGIVTVVAVRGFMLSIYREHSPFTERNVDVMRLLSKTYLAASVLISIADWFARGSVAVATFLFFGSVLVGVVIYCLALAFRYGGVLQKESDETLRGRR